MDLSWDSSSDEDNNLLSGVVLQAVFVAASTIDTSKQPMRTGQTRQEYVDKLLNSGYNCCIYNALCISISSFYKLRD